MVRFVHRGVAVPLALLVACLLAYAPLIPWLGLYADDWPFVYVNALGGLRGVVEFISWVRPVAAWIFAAQAALIGTHFWAYHILLILLRWVDALLLWRVLRLAWPQPGRGEPALWAALLFCVYPAFKQAPLALEYGPHFTALALLFLSFWGSLVLLTQPSLPPRSKMLLWAAAWAGSFQVFIIEYFVGLEVLRPVLVWAALRRSQGAHRAARRALTHWLPFLPVLGAFLLWRVYGLGFPSYQPELVGGLVTAPSAALRELVGVVLRDLWTAGIAAWAQPFTLVPAGKTGLAWACLVAAAFAVFVAFLVLRSRQMPGADPRPPGSRAWTIEALAFGAAAMFCAGWPFWITRIPLQLNFPWDRPSLAFMVGACLFAAGVLGLISLLPRGQVLAPLLASALLAASIGLHFQNANLFRKEGTLLKEFFWQLAWRAPSFPAGTAVVLDQTPFNYHSDKFLVPLLNWTYAPESASLATPYWLFDAYKLEEKGVFEHVNAPLNTRYGTLSFEGSLNRAVFVRFSPPSCLYLFAPEVPPLLPLSPAVRDALRVSPILPETVKPERPAQPPAFLGTEPQRGWCYYFEKIDLALQAGDAPEAARLGDTAFLNEFSPVNPAEYLPVMLAYAQVGRWEDAVQLVDLAAQDDFSRRAACAVWERLAGVGFAAQAAPALQKLQCTR